MELSDYRARIDQIDRQLVELFAQRMNTAAGIAAYKKEHGLPVLDPVREREKLLDVAAQAPEAEPLLPEPAAGSLFPADRGDPLRH